MNIKNFWETCRDSFAHLESGSTTNFEKIVKLYNFEGKTVLDYGIGGGYLGVELFKNTPIERYIGIDIAQRSLDKAKENLKSWEKDIELYLTPIDFSKFTTKIDIIVSLACIQHFTSIEEYYSFFKMINDSSASDVFLQIRKGEETSFKDKFEKLEDVGFACVTNAKDISAILTNFEIVHESKVHEPTHYQNLVYKRKNG